MFYELYKRIIARVDFPMPYCYNRKHNKTQRYSGYAKVHTLWRKHLFLICLFIV